MVVEAASGSGKRPRPAMVKMVDLPEEYLYWVLAQDKDDYRVPTLDDYTAAEIAESGGIETILATIGALQAAYDEFAEFRAWVRGALYDGGRVMVREDMLVSDPDEWQEMVDAQWAGARWELEEDTAGPLGPHTYMLSTYLALLYQYTAPVPTFWGT
ncbi:unnamed protein product [Urochloa decumbens]|uniref:Uncharacterized protein n=1 Tax=Urochloa decumbens TaxID=240449 RepID=A0ABC9AM90_9POAL